MILNYQRALYKFYLEAAFLNNDSDKSEIIFKDNVWICLYK